jgi:two-component system chemotaxis sensor kinase CheA
MDINDAEFQKKIIATYRMEAQEHIALISESLTELETCTDPTRSRELMEIAFRQAHSLKGASRSVSFVSIEEICQAMERVFSALKRDQLSPSKELFNLLSDALEAVKKLAGSADPMRTPRDNPRIKRIISSLEHLATESDHTVSAVLNNASTASKGMVTEPSTPLTVEEQEVRSSEETIIAEKTIRISVDKLDRILHQIEEFISVKLSIADKVEELHEIQELVGSWEYEWDKVSKDSQKIRKISENSSRHGSMEQVKPLLDRQHTFSQWNYHFIKSIENKVNRSTRSMEQDHQSLDSLVNGLLKDMQDVLMMPASSLLNTFPPVVRNLAQAEKKEVRLIIEGGGIAIDRRILDELRDPLIHLIRNAVDHGIEQAEIRAGRNKPVTGQIRIRLRLISGSRVEVSISDDGGGLDLSKIKASAKKAGILPEDEIDRMNDRETAHLIFRSGLSTSPIITDLSGHGLGLAIVLEKIENLGGNVSIDSTSGAGTTFHLVIPLTLVKFRGVLVTDAGRSFIIPMTYVERVLHVSRDSVTTVENHATLRYGNDYIPAVRLRHVLELPSQPGNEEESGKIDIVIALSSGKRVGFIVDGVEHDQDVLVKNLGLQLVRVRNISGTTVIGNGTLVPILQVPDLIKSAMKPANLMVAPAAGTTATKRRNILVAEDSITSRTLLKNILESAGYRVRAVVDGFDAWNALNMEDFDLVVSDVDMPRINGFDLTHKIRKDTTFANLPVILVTSLDSNEDRGRGIDAGANAYIVKSNFDQSHLLEIIERLAGA